MVSQLDAGWWYLSEKVEDIKPTTYLITHFLLWRLLLQVMSTYIFKRVTLAEDAYQNIQAKSKSDKANQHKITLQIDEENQAQFHELCSELVEQIESCKAKLGIEDDLAVPFDLNNNTLQVSWREKHHNTRVQFFEHGGDGVAPIELKPNQIPNAHSGTVLSLGLRCWADVSEATDQYKARVWINVIPDVVYFLDVKLFQRQNAYTLEDTRQEIFDDAADFWTGKSYEQDDIISALRCC